jgi:uncharacterized protein (DUF1786 family)
MKILALDIGAGTKDVLLYDQEKANIENCIKLILPTPSLVFAERVRTATVRRSDVFLKGSVIGGGALAHALRKHIESGLRVFATEQAAYTIRNDLDEVREAGIEIISKGTELGNFNGETLELEEINIGSIGAFLAERGEFLSEVAHVAVAVQDHGVSPKGIKNRKFRIQKMKELLNMNPKPEVLAFTETEIPSYFLRMKSAALASKRYLPKTQVLLMDTAPAAILGCLQDPVATKAHTVLVVNVGNGHTLATVISNGRIIGLLEHHTRLLTPQKLEHLLIRFADGELGDEEVFLDNGHGSFFLDKPCGFSKIETIVATGPNRSLLNQTNLSVYFAAPSGDVMMTGPIGLVQAVKKKYILE